METHKNEKRTFLSLSLCSPWCSHLGRFYTGSRTLTLIFAMLDLHAVENQAKYKLTYRNKRTDRVTHTHTGFIELLRNSKLINFLKNFYKKKGKEVALVETNEKILINGNVTA